MLILFVIMTYCMTELNNRIDCTSVYTTELIVLVCIQVSQCVLNGQMTIGSEYQSGLGHLIIKHTFDIFIYKFLIQQNI